MLSVRRSFAHCQQVARRRARNFYYSFLLLPREQRQAMCAVYAFMRRADDIGDGAGPTLPQRQEQLGLWRQALSEALNGRCGADPVLPAFHATVNRYRIPHQSFLELLDGVAQDLQPAPFQSFDDLYRYCYRVAAVVGLTTVHVFGFQSAEALRLAERCGIAFQLTNILRDIPEDARQGRVYLPNEDLRRFGVTADDLRTGRTGADFRRLMEFEWTRADLYYRESQPLIELVQPESRAALWAMVTIYRGILLRIRRRGYDVFSERIRLRAWEKTWILVRALSRRLQPQAG
jgi:phytoene synthase